MTFTRSFQYFLCVVVFSLSSNAHAQFEIDWFTIDGGGGSASGGGFELQGTIGQFDAGTTMSNGQFELVGGFWASTQTTQTLPLGDFDGNGVVDCADFDGYIGNIGSAAAGALSRLDIDSNGTLSEADADLLATTLVVTTNGVTGTVRGDLNCDGQVNVLGDAFSLVGSLGTSVTTYGAGDANFDGTVSVLGDAFILIGALGFSNDP